MIKSNNITNDNLINEDLTNYSANEYNEDGEPKKKKLLCPKYDPVFQSLFSLKHKDITSYLISAILNKKVNVVDVFTEYSIMREYPEEKIGRLDFLATTSENEFVHIEVQLVNEHNSFSRLLYSYSKIVSKQLVRGNDYKQVKRTISIILANFRPDEIRGINKMHTVWHLREDSDNEKMLTNLVEYHIINMTKAKKEYKKDNSNILAQWLLFICNPNQKEVANIMENNDEIKSANNILSNLSEDDKLRMRAEILERWEMEEEWNKQATLEYGKNEEKLAIAKAMLNKSIDIDTISEVTGLNKEEILKLNDEIN